ncbi:MAG: hypothetical protein PHG66_00495 [Candidatus Colwellbacteria bacterium]|nr:hypothetical protein [Candidatus Colwellbacteria bacterium]
MRNKLEMVSKMSRICKYDGCDKYSTFGKPGSKIAEFCSAHKQADYEDVKNKTCSYSECNKIPTFGKPGSKTAEFCSAHKQADYEDVKNKTCSYSECNKLPVFGKPGSKIAEFCSAHKQADYVDVKNKTCSYSECCTRPVYGKPGSKIAEFCSAHKQADYVDVKSKTCISPGCLTRPNYGKPGSKIAEFCSAHKQADYVDVKHKTCSYPECNKIPNYGKPGSKTAEFCSAHKQADYEDVKNKTCSYSECNKLPVFGKPGSKIAEFCSAHKQADYVDVKHKICLHPKCGTRATFGLLFQQKTSCAKHRTPNMYTKNKPKCEHEICKETPNYTDKDDSYPLRCGEHKLDDDIQISEANCMICDQVLFIKSDSKMCNICAKVDITTIRHEKELKVKTLLEESEIDFIHDKTSDPSCHKHRPDFLIDCETHYIVIEVDENQHSSYADECETARMVNIQQGIGGPNVLFIRFNPDGYTDSGKNKVRAGITLTRKKRLVSLIKSSMLHPPPYLLSVVKLYYDGDDERNKITEIDVDNLFHKYADIIFE